MISRWLTPPRRRGVELLDLPDTADDVRAAAMRDLERSNRLFGGRLAVRGALKAVSALLPPGGIAIDVATGTGDIPAQLRSALPAGFTLIGLDGSPALALVARARLDAAAAGDALALPFRDRCADVVTCSQALHHFFGDDARRLVAELHRVARGHVVIADLRRSRLAAWGFWLAATALRFHPVTRADGVTSVFRGFTGGELRALVREVTGVTPVIRRGMFWRVSATWAVPQRTITS